MNLAPRQARAPTDVIEKTLDPAVILAGPLRVEIGGVEGALGLARPLELRELVERVRPIGTVDEIEIGVARMVAYFMP